MLDNQYADRPRNVFVEWIKHYYLKLFDGFIYGGDTHENYLRILGVPIGREVYGYNCVDNDLIDRLAKKFRSEEDKKLERTNYFLCVARFIEKKNLPRLILAYADYKAKVSKDEAWKLVLVGDGRERPTIEREIERFGLHCDVELVGRVDDFEEVVRWLVFSKVLILPSSHNEQWGLVVNEAMAANLPIIVSRKCGCASSLVKEGENGFTFDPLYPEQLANHMVWMHKNENRLHAMGQRSFQIVQQYSPETFARNIRDLYQRVSLSTSK
jgi:glycosyltransferase involved in cell wall biosynthesis